MKVSEGRKAVLSSCLGAKKQEHDLTDQIGDPGSMVSGLEWLEEAST